MASSKKMLLPQLNEMCVVAFVNAIAMALENLDDPESQYILGSLAMLSIIALTKHKLFEKLCEKDHRVLKYFSFETLLDKNIFCFLCKNIKFLYFIMESQDIKKEHLQIIIKGIIDCHGHNKNNIRLNQDYFDIIKCIPNDLITDDIIFEIICKYKTTTDPSSLYDINELFKFIINLKKNDLSDAVAKIMISECNSENIHRTVRYFPDSVITYELVILILTIYDSSEEPLTSYIPHTQPKYCEMVANVYAGYPRLQCTTNTH
jgi:hypothetical protein